MKEIPTLFSGPMVVSILENRKTQTRRPMSPQPSNYVPSENVWPQKHPGPYLDAYNKGDHWCWWSPDNRQGPDWIKCPFGKVGDVLTISEAVTVSVVNDEVYSLLFAADGKYEERFGTPELIAKIRAYKRPQLRGVFLPPAFQRNVKLPVIDIRVQRVQEISEEDAMAEGVEPGCLNCGRNCIWETKCNKPTPCYRDSFIHTWHEIYGTWDANPWVWAATFEVVKRPSPNY